MPIGQEVEKEPCAAIILFDAVIHAEPFWAKMQGCVVNHAAGHDIHIGGIDGKQIAAIVSRRTGKQLHQLLATLASVHRPKLIVSAGDAMALVQDIAIGKLFIASEVAIEGPHSQNQAANESPSIVLNLSENQQPFQVGRLLSRPDVEPKERLFAKLGQHHKFDALDAQGYTVAALCREQAIPAVIVRAITESLFEDTPKDVSNYYAQKSFVGKFGALAGAVWRKPSQVKTLWKKKERSFNAGDQLATFLVRMFTEDK